MIVRCEQCETRFQLDDARVPAAGIRVRCSSCKHAFFLQPAGTCSDDALHGVASAAADTGLAAPETTQDLPPEAAIGEITARFLSLDGPESGAGEAEGECEGEAESDWQFNREEPEPDQDPELALPAAEAPDSTPGTSASPGAADFFGSVDDLDSLSAEVDAALDQATVVTSPPHAVGGSEAVGAEDLGDPEDWNLLGGSEAAPATVAGEAAVRFPTQGDASAPASPARQVSPSALAARDVEFYESPLPERGLLKLPAWVTQLGRAVGWALVVGLSGWGVYSGTVGVRPPPSNGSAAFASSGFRAAPIDAHWLDTALAGTLYVVEGRLRNIAHAARAPGPGLRVRLFADSGVESGSASAPLIQPLEESRLRTLPASELRGAADQAAERFAVAEVPPGAWVPFRAIFHSVPELATHLVLEAEPPAVPESRRGS